MAAVVSNAFYPQSATVTGPMYSEITYIDGVVYLNTTLIAWGNVQQTGIYQKNMTVTNTGSANTTYAFIITGLPVGWAETWTGNNTLLAPAQTVIGNLTLTVSAGATPASYTWNSWLQGSG